jgi:DNA-binding HxlR family transcriptional regulator
VTYQLTESGKALKPALIELGTWADKYLEDPPGAERRSAG